VRVFGPDGKETPIVMGSYCIGVNGITAAAIDKLQFTTCGRHHLLNSIAPSRCRCHCHERETRSDERGGERF